ncbi:hypothetical protein [Piscinibacter gummiphilus]|uniref:hypothetical protein n=1 Tax=Piscinibacter gummiphilus TaxID=946333 RepID=UPI0012F507CB|nr:hypothetical protein [Piscinibacter gummiphilus]
MPTLEQVDHPSHPSVHVHLLRSSGRIPPALQCGLEHHRGGAVAEAVVVFDAQEPELLAQGALRFLALAERPLPDAALKAVE